MASTYSGLLGYQATALRWWPGHLAVAAICIKNEKRKDIFLHQNIFLLHGRVGAGSRSSHFFLLSLFANVLFQLVMHDVSPSSNLNVPMFTMQLLKLRLRAAIFFLVVVSVWKMAGMRFPLCFFFLSLLFVRSSCCCSSSSFPIFSALVYVVLFFFWSGIVSYRMWARIIAFKTVQTFSKAFWSSSNKWLRFSLKFRVVFQNQMHFFSLCM